MTDVGKPTQQRAEDPVEYIFDRDGTVRRCTGVICWRFERASGFLRHAWTFAPSEGKPVLTIRRSSFWSSAFEIREEGSPVGTIRRVNVLRTQYLVTLNDGTTWNVHVPPRRPRFDAISNSGAQISIALEPLLRWRVLTEPRSHEPRTLLAIAFIYHEWHTSRVRSR